MRPHCPATIHFEEDRISRALWYVIASLSALVALYAMALLFDPAWSPPFLSMLRSSVPWAVTGHLSGGGVALAVGAWQFSDRLRAVRPRVHRWLGRMYVLGVSVGGMSALVLAPRSQEGLVTHLGFGLLALLWLGSTLTAYRHIRSRDVRSHRDWMTRSFALTLAAVTLRIYLPLAVVLGIPFGDAYQVVAWLCWVPNLIIAEWLVLRRSARIPVASVSPP